MSPFKPPAFAVLLNILWFSSLVSSLASASIGIIVKQWLKEYSVGLNGSSREIARRRQYRLNNLEKWRVATIVDVLPILLQIALVLFLTGLLLLLWNTHLTVSIAVAIVVAILIIFLVLTTILPTVLDGCCYYSPQAYATFWLAENLIKPVLLIICDTVLLVVCIRALWAKRPGKVAPHSPAIFTPSEWKAGDKGVSNARDSVTLDGDLLLMAYKTTMDVECFDTAEACLADAKSFDMAERYVSQAHRILTTHWEEDARRWPQDTLTRYHRLATCAIQIGLVTKGQSDWKETQSWVMDTMIKNRFPLPDRRLTLAFNTPVTAVVKSMQKNKSELPDFLGCLAIVSMGFGEDFNTAQMAWEGLVTGGSIGAIGDKGWPEGKTQISAYSLHSGNQSSNHIIRQFLPQG